MTAKKTENEVVDPATEPQPEGTTAPVTDNVTKSAFVSPEEAFELTKAPTPVNPPTAIGSPGVPTPDQRKAAEKRAFADGALVSDVVSDDPMVVALKAEREGYERRGDTDRVKQVDEQIKARTAPKGRNAGEKSTA